MVNTPEKGFKEWKSALLKGDLKKANARTTQQGQMLNAMLISALNDDADAKKNLEKTKIVSCTKNGNTAKLKVKNADGSISDFDMVKEDGKWKVDVKK